MIESSPIPPLARPRELTVESVAPAEVREIGRGRYFLDFGRAAFGTLRLRIRSDRYARITVHLGEKLDEAGRIDRDPPGCVRYRPVDAELAAGWNDIRLEIPPDERNTGPRAIRMPEHLFEVLPFRYAEIEIEMEAEIGTTLGETVQEAVVYPFDESAAAFRCEDDRLNRVWDLCQYTIKGTGFCGLYIDGDRERIPYEADAYINQLCHYGVDAEYEMARATFEHLVYQPTWPTDWALHFVPMAWADYQYTGRDDLLRAYWPELTKKALYGLARADGLISTETGKVTEGLVRELHLEGSKKPLRDLIDWPPGSFTEGGLGERDGYDMVPVKTVINSLHIRNLRLLARIGAIIGRAEESRIWAERAAKAEASLHSVCFRPDRGIFVDGEGSDHASLHANVFPAAFGQLPPGSETSVLAFLRSRGMACSVYGARYILEACYRLGDPDYALDLMTAEHDRGWLNMLRAGSTMTLEAWDWRYKNNLDWNHAWGAAPANIIPRFLVGVRPAEPGFAKVRLAPRPGWLREFEAKVPTPKGPVFVRLVSAATGRRLFFESPVPVLLDTSGLFRDSPAEYPPGRHTVEIAGA